MRLSDAARALLAFKERTQRMSDPSQYMRGASNLRLTATARLEVEAPIVVTRPTTFKKHTRIGAYTTINGGFIDHCISIGRQCSIGQDVRIGEPNHPIDWLSSSTFQHNTKRYGWHDSANSYTPTE